MLRCAASSVVPDGEGIARYLNDAMLCL